MTNVLISFPTFMGEQFMEKMRSLAAMASWLKRFYERNKLRSYEHCIFCI